MLLLHRRSLPFRRPVEAVPSPTGCSPLRAECRGQSQGRVTGSIDSPRNSKQQNRARVQPGCLVSSKRRWDQMGTPSKVAWARMGCPGLSWIGDPGAWVGVPGGAGLGNSSLLVPSGVSQFSGFVFFYSPFLFSFILSPLLHALKFTLISSSSVSQLVFRSHKILVCLLHLSWGCWREISHTETIAIAD